MVPCDGGGGFDINCFSITKEALCAAARGRKRERKKGGAAHWSVASFYELSINQAHIPAAHAG